MKIGFIGLGIMGAPMALHLVDAGHQLFVNTRRQAARRASPRRRRCACANAGRGDAPGRGRLHRWCPTRPTSSRCCSARTASPRRCRPAGGARKIVVDMSSISPMATKAFAKKINALGADYIDAPVSGGEVGAKAASLTIMCGGDAGGVRDGQAAAREDGQEHHPGRRQRRRPDDQGRQPDHRRAQHRRGRRGAAVREQGRRRPGQGAPGADGRLRAEPHPRGARRADDQAHLRSGLSHPAAPEGPGPGAAGRARARRGAAADRRARRS